MNVIFGYAIIFTQTSINPPSVSLIIGNDPSLDDLLTS
uniref:Uncharacterized protein n=1 Tax=Rhizophora mucronata TaxID=61149 RepID=A0A2P2MWJ2_RHIMU